MKLLNFFLKFLKKKSKKKLSQEQLEKFKSLKLRDKKEQSSI
jgi:hypothetical protein